MIPRLYPGLTCGAVVWLACVVSTSPLRADEVDELIAVVAKAGPQGRGSAEARIASRQLSKRDVEILPRLLHAMDTPNVVAANWYRTVYEAIVEAEAAKPKPAFPVAFLQEFARDSKRQGRPRRMVLRLLDDLTPSYRNSILPTLTDDPEFRTDAIAFVLQQGEQFQAQGDMENAQAKFQAAFQHARDVGQVTRAADRLNAIGLDVNIINHMGFVTRWYLLGAFDAPGRSGFDESFPPEKSVDLTASYTGQDGSKIEWKLFETPDRLGQLNLAQAIAPVKEAVGYAYAELNCPRDQNVQLRCGADDNLSVWVNGEKIFARRQWLNGTRLDRFTAPASLSKGKNRVLVKICQGPQHKNPAVPNNWSVQLRFCDETGSAADFESALPETAP
jgi:hypothetical protein